MRQRKRTAQDFAQGVDNRENSCMAMQLPCCMVSWTCNYVTSAINVENHKFLCALHVVLFMILLQKCIPRSEIWPYDLFSELSVSSVVYVWFRLLRLGLRVAAFTVCTLRFFGLEKSQERAHGYLNLVTRTVFDTTWPTTDRRAFLALVCFCVARACLLIRAPMEAYINYTGHFDYCAGINVARGLSSRSYILFGMFIGFRYLNIEGSVDICRGFSSPKRVQVSPWANISTTHRTQILLFVSMWVMVCIVECSLLFYWEVGVISSIAELDAFGYPRDFFRKYNPTCFKFHFSRVVLGNWREPFYFVMAMSLSKSLCFTVGTFLVFVLCAKLRPFIENIGLGLLSYACLSSCHHLHFLTICLFVGWECCKLQGDFEEFKRKFPKLSCSERLKQHESLGLEMEALSSRVQPLIMFVVVERMLNMSLDIALWSCESVPFTVVHYIFRHLLRTLSFVYMIWRVGRLNASVYDDLTGTVLYELVSCHQRFSDSDSEKLQRYRRELKDWVAHLRNCSNGRRPYCLRVCQFQCSFRVHTVAFWTLTAILFPLGQKLISLLPGI